MKPAYTRTEDEIYYSITELTEKLINLVEEVNHEASEYAMHTANKHGLFIIISDAFGKLEYHFKPKVCTEVAEVQLEVAIAQISELFNIVEQPSLPVAA